MGSERRRRWILSLCLIALLSVVNCGGGGDEPSFYITVNEDFATDQAVAVLSGRAALPEGSERSGGTVFMPIVTCRLGPYTLVWLNEANDAQGSGIALWDCPADTIAWSAFRIPLAMGANPIAVTFADSVNTAQAKVTVTRQ